MAPVKRKTTKKMTTASQVKPISDPFNTIQVESSINKTNHKQTLNPSPKKSSKSKPSSNNNSNVNGKMSREELKVMLEDFDLEAAAQLRSLTSKMEERLEVTKRHWKSSIETLDPRTSHLSYRDFLELYQGEFHLALQAVSLNEIPKAPMGFGEQSVRKRKRVLDTPILSQQVNSDQEDDDDVFGHIKASNTKKARPLQPPSSTANKNAVASSSKARAGPSSAARRVGGTPSGSRSNNPTRQFNRLSIDPSTNFVYRVDGPLSLSQSHRPQTAPPTPMLNNSVTASAIKRKPRRGESIIMLSVNDSPLGYLMADEVDDNGEGQEEEEEEEEDGEEGEEWDLMERHEASRVEEQEGKGKGKAKGKATSKSKLTKPGPPSSSTSTKDPPSSATRQSNRLAQPSSSSSFNPPQKEFTFGTTVGEEDEGEGEGYESKMDMFLKGLSKKDKMGLLLRLQGKD